MQEDSRFFVMTVDYGNISQAARKMGITPSTVSKRISKLEEYLQVALLYRNTRGISLTDAGKLYYERIKYVLEKADEAERDVRSLSASPQGVLSIAAGFNFSRLVLSKIIARFQKNYPDMRFNITLTEDPIVIAGEGIDICFQWGDLKDTSLVAQRVMSDRIHYVCSESFASSHNVLDASAEYLYEHFIATPRSYAMETLRTQDTVELPRPAVTVNNVDMARELVLLGVGVTALPGYCARELISTGALIDLGEKFPKRSLDCHAVFHAPPSKSKKISAFLKYTREYMDTLTP